MIHPSHHPCCNLTTMALAAIENADLQSPPLPRLLQIITCAEITAYLLRVCAVEPPSEGELCELFEEFVVRAVNRAPGVGDVLAN
jgi:hypothetical protein